MQNPSFWEDVTHKRVTLRVSAALQREAADGEGRRERGRLIAQTLITGTLILMASRTAATGESGDVFCQGFHRALLRISRCALVDRWEKERDTGARETSLRYFISAVHVSVSLVHFVCDGQVSLMRSVLAELLRQTADTAIPPSTLPISCADRLEGLRTVMDAVHR
ncbi:hypothetical protein QQF64_005926 [Cirrhinus molitorella]|uniref:Uncharacterized protein n=1 Tax=Cirrhinus molitorella TaxID=172907 RepID=A0ABR3MGY6_9TELE